MYSYAMTDSFSTAEDDTNSEGSYAVRNQWTFNEYLETGSIQANFDPTQGPHSPTFNQMEEVTASGCVYQKLLTSANSNCRFYANNDFSPITYGNNNFYNSQAVFNSSSFEHGSGTMGQGTPSGVLHDYQCLRDDGGGSFPCSPPGKSSGYLVGGSEGDFTMQTFQLGVDLDSLPMVENNNMLSQQNFHSTLEEDPICASSMMEYSMQNLGDGFCHEVFRRSRRREQNRVAARKCREKKKENVDNMLKDYTETLKENERLRRETEKLQSLVNSLQTMMRSHETACSFPFSLQLQTSPSQ